MTSDLFEGTWRANIDKITMGSSGTHRNRHASHSRRRHGYLMMAYGIKDGQAVAERPARSSRRTTPPNCRSERRLLPGALCDGFGSRPDPKQSRPAPKSTARPWEREPTDAEDGETLR